MDEFVLLIEENVLPVSEGVGKQYYADGISRNYGF